MILCDQLRPDFLSIYGCAAIPTPNLERLADLGVVFERAITASTVCAPARASMMTGRYVSDHGVWTNSVPFRPGMETIAERMNDLGYRTGAFGKLHHCPDNDTKGFQTAWLMEEGRLGADDDYRKHLKAKHPDVTGVFNEKDGVFTLAEDDYYETCIANQAISFIAESPAPFFAWVSFQGPHTPLDPPASVKGCVDVAKLPSVTDVEAYAFPEVAQYRRHLQRLPEFMDSVETFRVRYAELIAFIDIQIGRLLLALKESEQLRNTTIMFSADHGDLCGDYGMMYKGPHPYPAQLNIPLVLANHPGLPGGSRSTNLANNIDIPGTALDIAGDKRLIGMSRSLVDLALRHPENPRQVNFSEFCDSIRTVEDERYRYSYYPFSQDVELFDLQSDPRCTQNLAGTLPEIENAMLKHLVDFSICTRQVRIEAGDLVPGVQEELLRKHPRFLEDYKIYWPASARSRDVLKENGMDPHFDRILDDRPIEKGRQRR